MQMFRRPESIINKKTGVLFDDYSVSGLIKAVDDFEKMKFSLTDVKKQGQKFSRARFEKQMLELIDSCLKK